jgi:hypothetical protein
MEEGVHHKEASEHRIDEKENIEQSRHDSDEEAGEGIGAEGEFKHADP